MTQDVEGKKDSYVIYPRRFRWLKRGARGFVLLLLITGILRFLWGYEADERFAELGPAARARGEPFYPEDFRQLPIPDEENAAVPIQTAVEQLSAAKVYRSQFVTSEVRPPEAKDLPQIEALLSQCQSELQLVRSARSRPKAIYAGVPSYPRFKNGVPNSTSYLTLSRVLGLAAEAARARNRDSDAIEYVRDILVVEDTVGHSRGSYIDHLCMMSLDNIATRLVFQGAADLKVDSDSKTGASREEISKIIALLLDESTLRTCAVNGYFDARMQILSSVASKSPGISMSWFNEPAFKLDCRRLDQHYQMAVNACRQSNWQSARRIDSDPFDATFPGCQRLETFVHPLTAFSGPRNGRIIQFFRTLSDRRMAATMLAIRLYAVDHQGALPESLSALVPQYLPAVPSDPFDANDHPIRYLPKYNPPVLYSVGQDGRDDSSASMTMSRWRGKDNIYPLVAEPRISPPRKPMTRRSTVPQK